MLGGSGAADGAPGVLLHRSAAGHRLRLRSWAPGLPSLQYYSAHVEPSNIYCCNETDADNEPVRAAAGTRAAAK